MFIIVANDGENQVTVIRTINSTLATSHTAVLSVDGRIVKHNSVIQKKSISDKVWEQVNHPNVTPLLKRPNADVTEVLNMSAAECITNVIDEAGVWNQPTGRSRDSDSVLSDMIAIVDVDRTIFTQDIVDADEYVPVWSTSYVRDYYNSAFTSLELQLANTLLHVVSSLGESIRNRQNSTSEPKPQWNPLESPELARADDKKDPPENPVIINKYNPIAAAVNLLDIEDDGCVEDARIDKSYCQVPDFYAVDDLEDYPTYRGMDMSDFD